MCETNKSYKIIVSRYNESIEWTNTFNNVIIYNKGSELNNRTCINLPNVGREGHTYYTYIYDNYDSLPDYCIFLQGNPFDHSPNLIANLQRYIDMNFKNIEFEFLSERVLNFTLTGGNQSGDHPGIPMIEVYNDLFQKAPSAEIHKFGAGAQFIVSKHLIHNHPKDFYLKIIDILKYSPYFYTISPTPQQIQDIVKANGLFNHPIEGFVIERLHTIIFKKIGY